MRKPIATAAFLLAAPPLALAQDQDHRYRGQGYAFFGVGLTGAAAPVEHEGFGGEGFVGKRIGLGAEVGYARGTGYDNRAGVGSVDLVVRFRPRAAGSETEPFLLAGYTVMAHHGTSSSANFGAGANIWFARHAALRVEAREHTPNERSPGHDTNLLEFRFGVTFR
jgi:hypothetical protein